MLKENYSNAQRFLNAYNSTDKSLRAIYGLKRSLSFADSVRKCVRLNYVVRKYEEDLIDYGRLRNAIVHYGQDDKIIAEPLIDVVEKFEQIAKLLATPPKAIDISVKPEALFTIKHNQTIYELEKQFYITGYDNIPVTKDGVIVGVVNSRIVNLNVGKIACDGGDIAKFLTETRIEEILHYNEKQPHYIFCDDGLTIEDALNMFMLNKKLIVILITKTGNQNEKIKGFITNADIMKMNNLLDVYD